MLASVTDVDARNLLCQLLHRDPLKRLSHADADADKVTAMTASKRIGEFKEAFLLSGAAAALSLMLSRH